LEFDGLEATPGEACEAGCGAGRLLCDPETQSLFCDGPETNDCGGCEPLAGPVDGRCGCGNGGRWVCDGTGVICEGGDTNACGGCGPLGEQPGKACTDGAVRICVSRDATACVTFSAGSNACGGVVALGNLPGGECGACESGTFACTGPDEVGCSGDRAAAAFNACGGCTPLVGADGEACGTCGLGTLTCSGEDALRCDGDPGASALNACGGCAALANAPGTGCGTCATWRCVGGGVQCLSDPAAAGCGGTRVTCAELNCGGENRRCTEATASDDAACGTCLDGYVERAGSCEEVGVLPTPPVGVAATTSRPNDVRVTWEPVTAATSYEVEIDGSGTWIAVASSPYDDSAAPPPTLTACVAAASDGASGTEVTLTCTGDGTTPGTSRSYRVRAVGTGGTSGASAAATGNRVAGARSYQWQRSADDSDAAYTDIGGALAAAASTDTMSGITPPAVRRYRAVVSASGATSVTSNADRGNIAGLPDIVTQSVSSATVTDTAVQLSGSVSSLGGAPELVDHGFCVGPTSSPTPGGSGVTCSALGRRSTGAFNETVTGLTPATTYHVRAFGRNVAGTSFGTSRSFTTLAPALGPLGASCTTSADCASGLCSSDAVDPANHRCVPLELPSAAGGAMEFRYVPATPPGGFTQGSPVPEANRGADEVQWLSNVTRAYFVAETPVTQGQWKQATFLSNPSYYQDTTCVEGTCLSAENANDAGPVERVDWWSSAAYANWLSEQVGLPRCYTFTPSNWDRTVSNWSDGYGNDEVTDVSWAGPGCAGYRLPTESEREWATRGPVASGTLTTAFYWGPSADGAYMWYNENAGLRTQTPGSRLGNAYALRDMSGNVWEWVWDWYGDYPVGSRTDYAGPSSGSDRVSRGGSWYNFGLYARSASRGYGNPGETHGNVGFRLARTVVVPGLALGEACTANAECTSSLCSTDAVDASNRRCVPLELPSASGGAMEFRYVPATPVDGFAQGSPDEEEGRDFDESQWQSTITRAYFVGRTEVTQGQWKAATGTVNPAEWTSCGDGCPVERVDWWSAAAYANWLTEQAGLERCYAFTPTDWDRTVANWRDGDFDNGTAAVSITWADPACSGYRLPSETEWEWAARGPVASGTLTTPYYWGVAPDAAYLWYIGTPSAQPAPVGLKLANAYGLRDMSGNVWESVWDYFGDYPSGARTDYLGPASGSGRVTRGGGWNGTASPARSAGRDWGGAGDRYDNLGFRLVRTAEP
ncbi:MAG: SUMF1/EgtB/PvdO family nonheme iron enzyme, partial [Myxococcales bacterium]|nr:SUMF1/EgtB/PvdO family nonheme iron enzyme [Myxococcales bacterium]